MLAIQDIMLLLTLNEQLLAKAMRENDFERIRDLTVHRSCLKDCLIDALAQRSAA